jgi:hypothetical protein
MTTFCLPEKRTLLIVEDDQDVLLSSIQKQV